MSYLSYKSFIIFFYTKKKRNCEFTEFWNFSVDEIMSTMIYDNVMVNSHSNNVRTVYAAYVVKIILQEIIGCILATIAC